MDPIQPISRHFIVPLLRWKNRRKDLKYLDEAERAQHLPAGDLADLQLVRLRQLLIHAAQASPFYARRFAEIRFDPAALRTVADLRKLPLLTKADIQQNRTALMATTLAPDEILENQTGGSTGAPLRFAVSRESQYRRIANTIRHNRWAGLEPYHRAAAIWGHQRDLNPARTVTDRIRDAFYCRRVTLDTSHLTRPRLATFVERLNRTHPTTYVAYANAVYLLARYIEKRGLRDYHRPRSIITSAELLGDDQRQVIERVFGCPVFNRYGSREFSVTASECSAHAGLHIAADTLIVEIVRGGRPCQPGELGQIVVTDLHNYAMPFIRYQIGDLGLLRADACPCGRTFPRMEISGGRVTDFVVTPEGAVVSGAALTIYFIARVPGITQAQLVQQQRDMILLRLATNDAFGEASRKMIAESVTRFFGPRMHYEIEPVTEIAPEASGKYRFSISALDPLEYLT